MKFCNYKAFITGLIILFSGNGFTCDNSFCVNPEMPLLAQSSTRLASAISVLERDSSIKKDTGWCTPVAATMSLAGALKKSKNMSYSNTKLNKMRTLNVHWNSHINAGTFSDAIHYIGELMKTNWKKGITSDRNSDNGFKSIYNSIRGNVKKSYISKTTKHSSYNVNYFKSLHKGKFPATLLSIKQTNSRKRFLAGHSLALNGYEGSSLKIYDPWGRIYNVTISSTGSRSYPKISHVRGSKGAVEYYGRGSNYASLYSFSSFSVTDVQSRANPIDNRSRIPVRDPRLGRWNYRP